MPVHNADDLVKAIDEGFAKTGRGKARRYIGASIIGNQCDAYISLCMRGFPEDPPSPKLKRIFALGHLLEDRIVEDLKSKANLRVWEVDGLTGRQFSYEQWGGHVVCHSDGHIELDDGVLRILEIKTMNDASFKKFRENGVAYSHPQYMHQLQMMMGMSGFDESVFLAMNKNTCEYGAQIVPFDPLYFAQIKARIERQLTGEPQRRIASTPDDWRCTGCFKRTSCWQGTDVEKHCATCKHSSPKQDGGWYCDLHKKPATEPCASWDVYRPLEKQGAGS